MTGQAKTARKTGEGKATETKAPPMSRADRIVQILGDTSKLKYTGCREGDFEATTGGKGRFAHVLVKEGGAEILVGATVLIKYTPFKPVKPGVDPNAPPPAKAE